MASKVTVEVQDPTTLLWYNANIVDKQEGMLVVRYTDPLL